MEREALFYKKIDNDKVQCFLCSHHCLISQGMSGLCGVRKNINGTLYSYNFGKVSSISLDPIEKKPLYHFYPGSDILSIGTLGCNLKCPFCQNWQISQNIKSHYDNYTPLDIAKLTESDNTIGIAYTYSEPIVWYEFILETAKLVKNHNKKNVMVSNGNIESEPLKELSGYIDAWNIDLKGFDSSKYKSILKGSLQLTKNTIIEVLKKSHVELTTLIVTDFNDTIDELYEMAQWIASIDRNIPWHLSRYYPAYNYNSPPTDIDFIYRVYDKVSEILNYVYVGNVPISPSGQDTLCPKCKTVLIERVGYSTKIKALHGKKCMKCGYDNNILI